MAKHAKPMNATRADAERHINAHNNALTRWLMTGRQTRHAPKHGTATMLAPQRRYVEDINPFKVPTSAEYLAQIETAFYNNKDADKVARLYNVI